MSEDKVFTADNLPDDVDQEVSTTPAKVYDPIDPSETYTVQVIKVELRTNPFYKPDAENPQDKGSKYNLNFEFAILDDGEFYGRRIWDSTSLALKPTTKKGEPTKLYKIVAAAIKLNMSWDDCSAFAPDAKGLLKHLDSDVVGKQFKVAIENVTNPDTNKVKTKIRMYSQAKKELPAFDPEKSKKMGEAKKDKSKKSEEDINVDEIPF